jgi:drug/metabolite transporter (DMT)-like permease
MVRGRVLAALAAVYVVWGSTYLAIKHMVTGFPPQLGTGIRFLVAGAVLYILTARHCRRLSRRQWRAAFEVGILLIVGGVGAVTIAESYGVGSGVAATAAAAIPLWTVVLGAACGKRPGSTECWGIGAGLGGVGLLSLGGDFSANPLGLVLLLLAPISWAIGSVRRGGLDLPAGLRGVAAEMLAGGAVLLVVGAASGDRFTSVPRLGAWLAWRT